MILDALRERDLDAIAVDVAARRGVPLAVGGAQEARKSGENRGSPSNFFTN
jgi:hypothetical protein